jgi:hypothetical protein
VTYGDGNLEPDGDVDLVDVARFQGCFDRLGLGPLWPGKIAGEGVVDLEDYAAFAPALEARGP